MTPPAMAPPEVPCFAVVVGEGAGEDGEGGRSVELADEGVLVGRNVLLSIGSGGGEDGKSVVLAGGDVGAGESVGPAPGSL